MQQQHAELLATLKKRFHTHEHRHVGLLWDDVEVRIIEQPNTLKVLQFMEETGGEPDVLFREGEQQKEITYYDCAKESPKGRRSLCYDEAALKSRKDFPPQGDVISTANKMGISLLDEAKYRYLQSFGEVDTKTSTWIKSPDDIRQLGGALFGEFRYGHVFIFHNGAQSYYAARGFRGMISL